MNSTGTPTTLTNQKEITQPDSQDHADKHPTSKVPKHNSKKKGPYILGETLGKGAFAKVKVATHIHTKEKVAIKILNKTELLEDEKDIQRVKKEISILKKLKHKNIIQLYEIMESKKNLYIVMEYCEGKELFDYIVKKKQLTEFEACKLFQEIINGVEYFHSQKIVHRDLKPENILLDYKMTIKISDFGLSTSYENNNFLSTPCGTPNYAPPEMLRGDKYHGLYSDVWSCGIILYAMLCGSLPFGESQEEIIYQRIIDSDYVIPNYLSPIAVDLLNNIMKINPLERYDILKIKRHPWFNLVTPTLRPGITPGFHVIPVDNLILNKIEEYGFDKEKCRTNLMNNKYDSLTTVYYLCLRKFIKEGGSSISDLSSDEFAKYITDMTNIIEDKETPIKPPQKTILFSNHKETKDNQSSNSPSNTNHTASDDKKKSSICKKSQNGKKKNPNTLAIPNMNSNNTTANSIKTSFFAKEVNLNNKEPERKNQSNHKVSNSTTVSILENKAPKVYHHRVKQYSSSISSPISTNEPSAITPRHVFPDFGVLPKRNITSTKMSFLESMANKREKKATTTNNRINNTSSNISAVVSSTTVNNSISSKALPLSPRNELKDSNLFVKMNEKQRETKCNDIRSKPINNSISPMVSKVEKIPNKEKEIPMIDRKNSNSDINNLAKPPNALQVFMKDIEDDDDMLDEELNKIDQNNSRLKVLEYIAKKLVGNSVISNSNSTKNDKKSEKETRKIINTSFIYSKSTTQGGSNVNTTSQLLTQHKNKSFDDQAEQSVFRNVVSILNMKYKSYFSSNNNETNFLRSFEDVSVDFDKDEDIYTEKGEIKKSALTKSRGPIQTSDHPSHQSSPRKLNKMPDKLDNQKYKQEKLKNTKQNKFHNVRRAEINPMNYKKQVLICDYHSKMKNDPLTHSNKFLDISTSYDANLDSRNENSMDRSSSRKSDIRNMSFSPDMAINKLLSPVDEDIINPVMLRNSDTSSSIILTHRMSLTNSSSNQNVSSSIGNTTKVGASSSNIAANRQQERQMPIVVEDEEFNNFNMSVVVGTDKRIENNMNSPNPKKNKISPDDHLSQQKNSKSNCVKLSNGKQIQSSKGSKKMKQYQNLEKRVTINLIKEKDSIPGSFKDLKINNNHLGMQIPNVDSSEILNVFSPVKLTNINPSIQKIQNVSKLTKNCVILSPTANQVNSITNMTPNSRYIPPNLMNRIFSNIKKKKFPFQLQSSLKKPNKNNIESCSINDSISMHASPNKASPSLPVRGSNSFNSPPSISPPVSSKKVYFNINEKTNNSHNKKEKSNQKIHVRTSSAIELGSQIIADHHNECKHLIHSKHQRNKSQADQLNLNGISNYSATGDHASFVVKNSNHCDTLINCINQCEQGLYLANNNSNSAKAGTFTRNTICNGDYGKRIVENTKSQENPIYHKYSNEQVLEEFNSSTGNYGENKQISEENLKDYSGPIDFHCIINKQSNSIMQMLIDSFKSKKIKFIQSNLFKFKCSKNGISFEIEVCRLEKSEMIYVKFRLRQGDYNNYRKMVQEVLRTIK